MSAARHLAVKARRRWLVTLITAAVAGAVAAGGYAYYVAHALSNGYGASTAGSVNPVSGLSLGTGAVTPTANPNVPIKWNTTTLANGSAVDGYVVNRYDNSNALQTTGANCAGAVSGTTCTENSVPDGTWKYGVQAKFYSWLGLESSQITVKVDTSKPTITARPNDPSNSANPTFSFTHSTFSTFKCKLDGAGSFTTCTSGITVGPLADGSHTFRVEAVDANGFATSVASYTWMIDTVAPTVTIALQTGSDTGTSSSDNITKAVTLVFNVTFGESVSGLTAGAFSNAGTVTGCSFGSLTGGGASYTITASGCSEGTVIARLAAAAVTDTAGNANAQTDSATVTIDRTVPTVALSLAAAGSAAISGSTITYKGNDATVGNRTFKISATVSDTGGSSPASASFPGISTTGWTHAAEGPITTPGAGVYTSSAYTWNVSPTNPTGYSITYLDVAGNQGTQAITFVSDITGPTVTINQAAGQADPTSTSPINFTAVFNKPINTSTFTSGKVSVTGTAGGTKMVTITQIAPNNGTTFTVAVSGMTTTGTVIASIPAGGVSDLVGNTNSASTSTDQTVTYNAPVSVTGFTTTNQDGMPGMNDTITITFSGAVTPSSVCSAWAAGANSDGGTTDNSVSITLTKAASGNNTLSVSDSHCSGGPKIFAGGALDLATTGYVTTTGTSPTTAVFGPNTKCNGGHPCPGLSINAAGTVLTISFSGDPVMTGTVGTVASNPGVTYTPNAGITSSGGGSVTGTATDVLAKFF